MGRQTGIRSSGGTSDDGSIVLRNLEFSFFNDNGSSIEPIFSEQVITFENAVNNFAFSIGSFSGAFDTSENGDPSADLSSLNFTARYLPEGVPYTISNGTPASTLSGDPIIVNSETIEYGINSEELSELGLAEFVFLLEDEVSGQPGIQIGDFTIIDSLDPAYTEGDITIEDATNNPEVIERLFSFVLNRGDGTGNSLIAPDVRYSVFLASNANQIISLTDVLNDDIRTFSIPTYSLVLQAEELELHNYLIEDYEGGRLISRQNASGDSGTASLLGGTHDLSGIYDLRLSYFDENVGNAKLEVLIDGTVVSTVILSEDTASEFPTEDNRRELLIEDLILDPSDTITIRGTDDNTEWARVDFLELTSNSTTIEAESLSLPENTGISTTSSYSVESYEGSGQIISLVGQSAEAELLSSDHDLNGLYDLEIDYFDVSGLATLDILIGDDPEFSRRIVLNDDTDSTSPNEDNRQIFIIKNVPITPSQDLTLRGSSTTDDRVSIDSINITAASVTIEAEDLVDSSDGTYLVEYYEGGQLISRLDASGDVGEVSLNAEDYNLDGTFDIGVTYFDENDGEGEIEVLVTDIFGDITSVGSQSLIENTSSGLPNQDNRREFIIEDIDISSFNVITIRGIDDNLERARIDNITFYTSDVDTTLNTFDSLSLPDI